MSSSQNWIKGPAQRYPNFHKVLVEIRKGSQSPYALRLDCMTCQYFDSFALRVGFHVLCSTFVVTSAYSTQTLKFF